MRTFPIIQKAGGREAITKIVNHPTKGRVSTDAVKMWERRGSIPGYAISGLLEWAADKKVRLTPNDFRPTPKTAGKRRASR